MKQIKFVTFTFFLFLVISSYSQKLPMKLKKIDKNDLKMKVYLNDTSTAAVILGDFGDVYFDYNDKDGFYVIYEHHTRIKILKKEGYKWADQKIILYDSKYSEYKEKVLKLKGYTYNLNDGKIITTKLKSESKFIEKISDYKKAYKFTMPDVKVGSIIEWTYKVKSDFIFSLKDFIFQYSIPAIFCEYRLEVPEYFNYKHIAKGFVQFNISTQKTGNGKIDIAKSSRTISYNNVVKSNFENNTIDFTTSKYRWVINNVPAFISEPMLNSRDNYITQMGFELNSTHFPNSRYKNYTHTWEDINNTLWTNQWFGGQIKGGSFLKSTVKEINSSASSSIDKTMQAFQWVKKNIKWNSYNSIYPDYTLAKAFKEKTGNSSDVNLILTTLLRKLGLDANPVILSTRKNGLVNPYFPMLSQFNYVIASVTIDGKIYLLDATELYNPIELLPKRCLNGQGRMISKKETKWVNLNPDITFETEINTQMTINKQGVFNGTINETNKGYAAYYFRNELFFKTSEEKYIEEKENSHLGLDIEEYSFTDKDILNKPVIENYSVSISDNMSLAGDFIYFNPMLFYKQESNPFKLEKRNYPVDFAFPIKKSYKGSFIIPEGYVVEEIPKSISINIPDNAASFSYNISVNDNKIVIESNFNISKSLFISNEYPGLRKFYDKVVEKQKEQIVLKK